MKNLSLLVIALALCACQMNVPQNDNGYFMSTGQMANLITYGELKDAQNNTYIIWHIPGYVTPIRVGNTCQKEAWNCLKVYVDSQRYISCHRGVVGLLKEDAYENCLHHFAYEKTAKAWDENLSGAAVATEKGLIGSTFAYPQAFISSTVQTLFFVPFGIIGATLCTAVSPLPYVYIMAYPLIAAPVGSMAGLVVVSSGYAWNTIIAPPTAFISHRPTPERVDNNYVIMIPSEVTRLKEEEKTKLAQEKINQIMAHLKEFLEKDKKLQTEENIIKRERLVNRENTEKEILNNYEIEKALTELADQNIELNYNYLNTLISEDKFNKDNFNSFRGNLILFIKNRYKALQESKQSNHIKDNERFNPVATPTREIKKNNEL